MQYQGECSFFVAPRASISGDLLALSDFHWPRANGPVLVSSPGLFRHKDENSSKFFFHDPLRLKKQKRLRGARGFYA